jgi:DNA-directed RNA polymerase beta subunit
MHSKGRKIQGGQSVAELDIRALLTYDAKNILKETLTLKSDDFVSKREVVMNIVENGEAAMPLTVGVSSKTNQLFYVMMTGMGLYITK